jgi:transposase
MTLRPEELDQIPEETMQVAKAAFPKGNAYLKLRDELKSIYRDEDFADLFPKRGQPAESPGRLALITVLQFAEGLSDRQAADAVRSRIDWKYLLGLELSDPGFDYSVLSEFRSRLLQGGAEDRLLDKLVELMKVLKLIKERGQQRTDSTHIEAAVRQLNRLEKVGETLRAALNSLANSAPEWLKVRVPVEWYERYGARIESYRLPRIEQERDELAVQIGEDGYCLLGWAYESGSPQIVKDDPGVEILRRIWMQEYYREDDHTHWRDTDNMPPVKESIYSPYDTDAVYGKKRTMDWVGYKAHYTETCDDDLPHLIIQVKTTPAATADNEVVPDIHQSLADKHLLPAEHLMDSGYVDAGHVFSGNQKYGVCTIGFAMPDTSWQAKANHGFDLTHFVIDWEKKVVTCPAQHHSSWWNDAATDHGEPVILARFSMQDCQACPSRLNCTRSEKAGRSVRFRPQVEYETLRELRERNSTKEFKTKYRKRAGVEGTLSQGVRRCDLRHARYIGQAKTHLQNLAIATAINLVRLCNWLSGIPRAFTRTSPFLALAVSVA